MRRGRIDKTAAGHACNSRLGIDLFCGLDQHDAGKSGEPALADPLPGRRRAQDYPLAKGRDKQCRVGSDRSEEFVAQQPRQLRHRVRPAGSKWRAVEAGPNATPVRHDDQQTPAASEDPPDLLQHWPDLLARFNSMDDQDPVDRIVGEGEFTLVRKGDPIRSFRRPAEHAECGGHQGQGALGLRGDRRQKWCGITDPEKP